MIEDNIQLKLKERFNPEGSDLRLLQLRLLKILKYIDSICSKHNIPYWLSSGTCLGAIRHGGFIPWDDDVDIEMLEKDYKRFEAIVGLKPDNGFVLQNSKNEPFYHFSYSKMRDLGEPVYEKNSIDENYIYKGAFVDIFTLSPSRSKKTHQIAALLNLKLYHVINDKSKLKKWKYLLISSVIKTSYPFLKIIDSAFEKKVMRHSLGSWFFKSRLYSHLFPLQDFKFEDTSFPVPHNYDGYLKRIYGDYNKLPNLDNIKQHFSLRNS